MPRPINYVVKLRKWAKSTNGSDGLRFALLHTINQYVAGKARIEEVNKCVDKYNKSIMDNTDDLLIEEDENLIAKELERYLSDALEN